LVPAQGFEPWTIGLKVDLREVHGVSRESTECRSEYRCQQAMSTEIHGVSHKFILLAAPLAVLGVFRPYASYARLIIHFAGTRRREPACA